jgi:hypothetical protein
LHTSQLQPGNENLARITIILNLLLGRHLPPRLLWRMRPVGHGLLRANRRQLSFSDFYLVVILTRIDSLPTNKTKEVVEAGSKERSKERANPIDPVISGETAVDYIRTERASRVERSSGKVIT